MLSKDYTFYIKKGVRDHIEVLRKQDSPVKVGKLECERIDSNEVYWTRLELKRLELKIKGIRILNFRDINPKSIFTNEDGLHKLIQKELGITPESSIYIIPDNFNLSITQGITKIMGDLQKFFYIYGIEFYCISGDSDNKEELVSSHSLKHPNNTFRLSY